MLMYIIWCVIFFIVPSGSLLFFIKKIDLAIKVNNLLSW